MFADGGSIAYQPGKSPGGGKHTVFVCGDREYRYEESLPIMGSKGKKKSRPVIFALAGNFMAVKLRLMQYLAAGFVLLGSVSYTIENL